MKKCLIIIPTYNEASNIEPLIKAILGVSQELKGWSLEIVVADDNSPDGTAKIVRRLQKTHSKVLLLSGKREGLGRAYIRALSHGLKTARYKAFIMMDADFSHDPKTIPALIKAIDAGADQVIGSRYIKGGSVSDWPTHRKLNSFIANLLARQLLDIKDDVRDMTSGYRAVKSSAIAQIDLDNLRAVGYAFQVNLLHEFSKNKLVTREIPINFTDRHNGSSKMRLRDIAEFIYLSYQLNSDSRVRRIARFCLVGASGTIVNLAVIIGLVHWFNVSAVPADVAAIETSIISNFLLNHRYTFRFGRHESIRLLLGKLFSYNMIAIGGAAISFAVFIVTFKWIGWHYIISDLLGVVIAVSWNYWLSVRVVWKLIDE